MDKKIRLLVIGEVGYYSLFAEGYLRFFSEKKLKIKTSTFSQPEITKKVAAILEEDYIQSKENLIPLLKATSLDFHHLILIGDLPPDFSIKTDAIIHYFKTPHLIIKFTNKEKCIIFLRFKSIGFSTF